ncbi:MAG: hypothetical protein LUP95_05675 [Euryarchaeota archaeon]|nr:hypothetical protein [Euryarchaeota archaeon]
MRQVWLDSVQDIHVNTRKMIALDVNRPPLASFEARLLKARFLDRHLQGTPKAV